MEIPFGMKKTVLILMFALCYGLSAQTDIYRRYAKQPHVKVASVSNFSINSKTQVDVTVIEAVDDAGWNWMMKEFSISPLQQSQMNDLREGADVVTFARRNRNNPSQNAPVVNEQIDVANSCYVGISYLKRTLYIFSADSEEESEAVVSLLVKKMMHSAK